MDSLRSLQWFVGEITGDTAATILTAREERDIFVAYKRRYTDQVILAVRWFVGEIPGDTAAIILTAHGERDVFVAYKRPHTDQVVLAVWSSTRDTVEHFDIICTNEKYKVSGQGYNNIIAAVNTFATHHNPPLKPAFDAETSRRRSISDSPPSYDQAQRALQPEVAPLPCIRDANAPPRPVDHQSSLPSQDHHPLYRHPPPIRPPILIPQDHHHHSSLPQDHHHHSSLPQDHHHHQSSLPQDHHYQSSLPGQYHYQDHGSTMNLHILPRYYQYREFILPQDSQRTTMHGSDYWRYYQSHHCCHPRNVCHACCYYTRDNSWYNPCGKGLFLQLCLFIMWLPCVGLLLLSMACVIRYNEDDG